MHIQFDYLDFTKSAWSLAGGMSGVFLLAVLRNPADVSTLLITLGLPAGVISLWGIYSLKLLWQKLEHFFFPREEAGESPPGPQSSVGLPNLQAPFPYASHEPMPLYEPFSQKLRSLKAEQYAP